MELLKSFGPSAVSVELAGLSPEGGGASSLFLAFIRMIDSMLATGQDFDLAHAYLSLFLKVTDTAFRIIHQFPAPQSLYICIIMR